MALPVRPGRGLFLQQEMQQQEMQYRSEEAEKARKAQLMQALYSNAFGSLLDVAKVASGSAIKQHFEMPGKMAAKGYHQDLFGAAAQVKQKQEELAAGRAAAAKAQQAAARPVRGAAQEEQSRLRSAPDDRRTTRRGPEGTPISRKMLPEVLGKEGAAAIAGTPGEEVWIGKEIPTQMRDEPAVDRYEPADPGLPPIPPEVQARFAEQEKGVAAAQAKRQEIIDTDPHAREALRVRALQDAVAQERFEKSADRRIRLGHAIRQMQLDDEAHSSKMLDKGLERAQIEAESKIKVLKAIGPYILEADPKTGKIIKIHPGFNPKPLRIYLGTDPETGRVYHRWTVDFGKWTQEDLDTYNWLKTGGKGTPPGQTRFSGVYASADYFKGEGVDNLLKFPLTPKNLEARSFLRFANALGLKDETQINTLVNNAASLRAARAGVSKAKRKHGKESPQHITALSAESQASQALSKNLSSFTTVSKAATVTDEAGVKGKTAKDIKNEKKVWGNEKGKFKKIMARFRTRIITARAGARKNALFTAVGGEASKRVEKGQQSRRASKAERSAWAKNDPEAWTGETHTKTRRGLQPTAAYTTYVLHHFIRDKYKDALQEERRGVKSLRSEANTAWDTFLGDEAPGLDEYLGDETAKIPAGLIEQSPRKPKLGPVQPGAPAQPGAPGAQIGQEALSQLFQGAPAPPLEEWPEPVRMWFELNKMDWPASKKRRVFAAQAKARGWAPGVA